jgi:hypothetical protein
MTMLRRGSARSSVCASFLLALLFLPAAPPAIGQNHPVQSQAAATPTTGPEAHAVLIELFTSEGCSSCPPADVLLQNIDTQQPIPGTQMIVLSEHVTYWDHDGWKDPNSSSSLTDRQSAYEAVLGEKDVFTPQLIVDGTQVKLVDTQAVLAALQKAAATPKISVRIAAVTVDPANQAVLRARVETDVNSEKHGGDVYVAVALDHVESQVLKGENGGRHLVHVAVVQELTKVGKLPKGKSFGQDVQLKLKPGTDPRNVRVIAFVQESGPGNVLGAALRKPAV